MLFNSLGFLFFFPVVTTLYFLLPHRARWGWLLAASCYFYMTFVPIYILILLLTIAIDYVAALWIEKTERVARRTYLGISVASTILILFFFKYFNFATENLNALASVLHWNYPLPALKLLLPIGLSFHTFQSLAYVIEVYRGNQKPERHFGIYALYVMFYPQLVAGPIERPQNLLHQFHREHRFDGERAIHGINRMAYGFFKKMVVADRLAEYVNQVYADLPSYSTVPIVIAMVFFSIQIYCDFSGYSDIAIGSAEIMGFDLMENFDRPYLSRSITEFWRRWHRSLSTWFNDYLFLPLHTALRSYGLAGLAMALIATFLVSGLWHGAGWTFVVYGGLHGTALVYEALTKKRRKKAAAVLGPRLWSALSWTSMFGFVTFSYVFFRAANMGQVRLILAALLHPRISLNLMQICAGLGPFGLATSFVAIGLLLASYRLPRDLRLKHNLVFACAASALIILLGERTGGNFIYFQF